MLDAFDLVMKQWSLALIMACATSSGNSAIETPSTAVDPEIRALFDDYAKAMTDYELPRMTSAYAPTFIVTTPFGHSLVANDANHRQAVVNENAYYRDTLGMTSAKILSITQSSYTPSHHLLVHTTWGCTFKKLGDKVLQFPLSFVVEKIGDQRPRILLHIVEADEPKIFKDNGLI